MIFLSWLILTFAGPAYILLTGKVDLKSHYATANRESARIAPLPGEHAEAVVQVYCARAFNWRGIFGSHCWIATKPQNAERYMVFQVVGWRVYGGQPALAMMEDIPDRYWYNEKPVLLRDVRGELAEALIPRIGATAMSYVYAAPYRVWPGPNSNTFPAFIGRAVPELELVLPADAVGKDYLEKNQFFARAPSGTGYQFSLYGMLGLLVAKKEGIELNLLGLVYGVRFSPFKILLPGIG